MQLLELAVAEPFAPQPQHLYDTPLAKPWRNLPTFQEDGLDSEDPSSVPPSSRCVPVALVQH